MFGRKAGLQKEAETEAVWDAHPRRPRPTPSVDLQLVPWEGYRQLLDHWWQQKRECCCRQLY